MVEIKTLEDIKSLRSSGLLPPPFLDYLDGYYGEVKEALQRYSEGPNEDFPMEDYNTFSILEAHDDPFEIQGLGIQRHPDGIICWWEFCNLLQIGGLPVYQVGVLYDNESMGIFYIFKGQFGAELEELLEEHASCSGTGGEPNG